jgi:NAD(P) transhydrogenase subunit alpha
MNFQGFCFGIPKEILSGERRVAAIPETVRKLIANGAKVLVETGAGEGSHYSDESYRAAGAEIIGNVEEVYRGADIILKVKEPKFHAEKGRHEVDMMREGQYLVAFLHPANPGNHEMVKKLADRGIISLTLDSIPRISRAQSMDALTSMSTVAGYKGVLIAANMLPKFVPMVGTASGMIQPARTLVIGAGVAGLQAIATAKRLGSVVFAADIRPEASEQASSVGAKIIDLGIPPEQAVGTGGYARKLSDNLLQKERDVLREPVAQADIIILSALIPGKLAPVIVTGEMVKSMNAGSVIVDIAIDQGGNCELTEPGKTITRNEVNIIGIQNIPGMVAISSTWMFANNMYSFMVNLLKDGKIHLDGGDEIISSCLLTAGGKIVHAGAREAMCL